MRYERVTTWGSIHEDFSGADGGWFIEVDPEGDFWQNPICGLTADEVINDNVAYMPPVGAMTAPTDYPPLEEMGL